MVQSVHLPLHDENMLDADGATPIVVEQQKLSQPIANFVSAFCKKNPSYFKDIKVRREHALIDLERDGPKLPGRARQAHDFYVHVNENIHSLPATGESAAVVVRIRVISAPGDTSSLPQPAEAAVVATINNEGISRRYIKPVTSEDAPLEDVDIASGFMIVIQTFNPLMTPFKDNRYLGMGAGADIYGERSVDKDLGGGDAPEENDVTLPPGQVSPQQHTYVPVYPGEETPNLDDPSASAASVEGTELAEEREWQAEHRHPHQLAKAIAGGMALHEIEAHKAQLHSGGAPGTHPHSVLGASGEAESKTAPPKGVQARSEQPEGDAPAENEVADTDSLDENLGTPEGALEKTTHENLGLSTAEQESAEAPTRPEGGVGEAGIVDAKNDEGQSNERGAAAHDIPGSEEVTPGLSSRGTTPGIGQDGLDEENALGSSASEGQEQTGEAGTAETTHAGQKEGAALDHAASNAEGSNEHATVSGAGTASHGTNLAEKNASESEAHESLTQEGAAGESLSEEDKVAQAEKEERDAVVAADEEDDNQSAGAPARMSGASGTPEWAREAFAAQVEDLAQEHANKQEAPNAQEIADKIDEIKEKLEPPDTSLDLEGDAAAEAEETTGEAAARRAEARGAMTEEEAAALGIDTENAEDRVNVDGVQQRNEIRAQNVELRTRGETIREGEIVGGEAAIAAENERKKDETRADSHDIKDHLDRLEDTFPNHHEGTNNILETEKDRPQDLVHTNEKPETLTEQKGSRSDRESPTANRSDTSSLRNDPEHKNDESSGLGRREDVRADQGQDIFHEAYASDERTREEQGRSELLEDISASGERSHAEMDFSHELEKARQMVEKTQSDAGPDILHHAVLETVHDMANIAVPASVGISAATAMETTRSALMGTALGATTAYAALKGGTKRSPPSPTAGSPKMAPPYARRKPPRTTAASKTAKPRILKTPLKAPVKKVEKRVGEKKTSQATKIPPAPSSDPAPHP